ncbi:OLC1v1012210C1 [Oldenlandia corymbosa var. corymbosa]|uniref:OLC1v1012210C1 n=1 Tax=Oldenlandia corymbosa var. corymbosa TaxID=529605 RepID=A0AAV1DVK8_OLDCO|nr:OLC1v1012210C1 [Oldenlandia corymbosa var. corymbosa]
MHPSFSTVLDDSFGLPKFPASGDPPLARNSRELENWLNPASISKSIKQLEQIIRSLTPPSKSQSHKFTIARLEINLEAGATFRAFGGPWELNNRWIYESTQARIYPK